jgi:hypothetical protein
VIQLAIEDRVAQKSVVIVRSAVLAHYAFRDDDALSRRSAALNRRADNDDACLRDTSMASPG